LIRNHGTLVCVGLPRSGNPLPISPFWMCVRSEFVLPCLVLRFPRLRWHPGLPGAKAALDATVTYSL
jgi:hypothetical protein